MLEIFITVALTILVLAVIVPLALLYLLLRQVLRSPRVNRLFGRRLPGRGRRRSPEPMPAVGRPWSLLAADAEAARDRWRATVDIIAPGPLRTALREAAAEVDVAVAEAHRLAGEGSHLERAHREVMTALDQQRRRSRRGPVAPPDLADSLAASTAAQYASAQRLGEARERGLCQLQLVVARLDELTASTLELAAPRSPAQPVAVASAIADRVAALREATAEVDSIHLVAR